MRISGNFMILPAALFVMNGLVGTMDGFSQSIDLYEPTTWKRPVLIAHRGGVVTADAPENSAAAVRLAAERGFAMVEVDVRESKDHVPVAFHDSNLSKAVGLDARIEDLMLEEIKAIRHRHTGQEILTLDQFFELCSDLDLGVMLDIKTDGSESFFREIATLIEKHQLGRSAITFASHPWAVEYLDGLVMFSVTDDEEERVKRGEVASLRGKFWFGLPWQIDHLMVKRLQSRGALVIPAINTFRYPSDENREKARADIEWLRRAGVDAFQIDSVYRDYFETKGPSKSSR